MFISSSFHIFTALAISRLLRTLPSTYTLPDKFVRTLLHCCISSDIETDRLAVYHTMCNVLLPPNVITEQDEKQSRKWSEECQSMVYQCKHGWCVMDVG